MKRMAVLLVLVVTAVPFSQVEGITVTEFLSSAIHDPTLHFQDEKVNIAGIS